MNPPTRPSFRIVGVVIVLIVLGALFYFKAKQNYQHQDYINSNFFSFWLAGRMVWTGQSPYNTSQWLAGFDAFGATYRPSKILQYPLPLMFLMAPLGLLSVGNAYFVWQLVCLAIMAAIVYALIRNEQGRGYLFLPLTASFLFFGPFYLSLQVGSVGIISLGAIAVTILIHEKLPFLAGVALSLTLLKPPQALPLLFLAGIWSLSKKDWKLISGILTGGLLLFLIWISKDPLGLVKFRSSSDLLLAHTLGVQSNVFSFSYFACRQNLSCMWVIGSTTTLIVLMLGVWYLITNRIQLNTWEAFNFIIPVGFFSAVYLWSYDQLLYIIPIVWIAAHLLRRTHSYIAVILFLIIVDVVSFIALAVQATSHQDLLSITNTVLILVLCLWLVHAQYRTSSANTTSD